MATLVWISHAGRSLKSLVVEPPDLNSNNSHSIGIGKFLACYQRPVIVDKGASTTRLIHFTLRENISVHP